MIISAFPLLLLSSLAVSGAELFTVDAYRYGKFEARVRFAPSDGVVSSFFLWKPDSEMADVYWNELDIEKIGACHYSSNAFWGLPEQQTPQEIEVEEDICGEWHTHALEWTPQSIVWKLDDRELRRIEGDIAAAFEANAAEGMHIRFNLWVGTPDFGGNWNDASLPDYEYIQWVAYSAYTPGSGTDGSDFTLDWREDFDGNTLPSGWATGNWESPLGQSQHAPENVVIRDGVAILALTADDALGYDGTPPADPEEPDDDTTDTSSTDDSGDSSDDAGSTTSGGTTSGGNTDDGTTSGGTSSGEGADEDAPDPTATTQSGTTGGNGSSGAASADPDDSGDGGGGDGDEDTDGSGTAGETESSGCACHTTPSEAPGFAATLGFLGLVALRRRRRA